MAKPLFHGIKTHPSKRKKSNIVKNRADFNLRNTLENIAERRRQKMNEGYEAEEQEAQEDGVVQGMCDKDGCSAYDQTGSSEGAGEEKEMREPLAQKLANAIMGMKGNKYDRIQARKKRLNQQFRQGLGSKHNMVMYNPINRLRKRRANTQLYRLKQRHDGVQSA